MSIIVRRLKASCMLVVVLLFGSDLDANEINEFAAQFSIEAHCAASEAVYKECFDMDKSRCESMFSKIIAACGQGANGYPLTIDDPDSVEQFENCIFSKAEAELIDEGFDLDAPC